MMDQEIPFKIFPLARLNSSHVSAVKPVAVVDNTSYFQNFKPLQEKTQDVSHSTQDCFLRKISSFIEEENTESLNPLYSKLHREAEKIKKWKSVIELEMKEKESKLQEKRKLSDAQQRIIKELQDQFNKTRV
ncbi:synaptonemal complex protein 1-like isoform X2 [Rana temporaria]|uniref:synaptonemal complex protein 1-like isoform X2 n=1 Tax=Rana temporaria TaxID=8407 RepID=UPI001AAE0926|nr:synaptonemal complex protein 1-like isoform X2 [Rana temporaria]